MNKKNVIFYFSGTGNTFWAAKTVAGHIGDCELINIAKYKDTGRIKAVRVGIFFPVYYWGLPNIIRDFALKADIEADYIFELHTMGGYDGVATHQMKECFRANKMLLSASYRIKMPNNIALISKSNRLTDVHRIPDDKGIAHLIHKAEKKLTVFSEKILNLETHYNTEAVIFRPWHNYGYCLNELHTSQFAERGRKFNDTLEKNCTGCGQCSKVCPMENINIRSGKPVWGNQCQFCLACLHSCPAGAINYGYSKGKKRYKFPVSN